ncbi:MAG: kojibiose phosphorylase [Saprospiraceae bacterium]|jgi:kojibiose phosphorylase
METFKKINLEGLLNDQTWLVEETGFVPEKINHYETIFTVGNGFQGTRGALEEGFRGGLPGTYLAGIYDHHDSTVVDLVSCPDWLPVKVYIEGELLNMNSCKIVEYHRKFDLRQGVLYRLTVFEDEEGRITRYESIRFTHLSQQNIAALRICITPVNYSGQVRVESSLEGNRRNLDRLPQYVGETSFPLETKWEKWATSKHLEQVATISGEEGIYLEMKTLDRAHSLGYAANMQLEGADAKRTTQKEYEKISEVLNFAVEEGRTYQLDKLVTIGTSRAVSKEKLQSQCYDDLEKAKFIGFDTLLATNASAWQVKWDNSDCVIVGDESANLVVRFNTYHLLITANENDPKVNIGAKSLSGEGYKGHVFWDTEIFLLPFYIYTQPKTAKALLLYRYHCMEGAKKNAKMNGFGGAQYPWESADTGEETTPKWTHDGKHRIWTGEEEIHITADVAYGVLTYLTASDDFQFFLDYGAEMLFETARFWSSRLEYIEDKNHYELNRVIGPDEFHEHVDNNVFTNRMAQWNLEKVIGWYDVLKTEYPEELKQLSDRLKLSEEEVLDWQKKSKNIYIPFDKEKKLIEQFEGYFNYKEVPITQWDKNNMPIYPEGYDHFNADETTLVKQPDVIMLLYVLPDEFSDEIKRINYEFYEKRTMHKSSLSPSIHSIMGIEIGDTTKAVQYFERSAFVDLIDNQGNTDMGMHIASCGGTWQTVVFGFGGVRVKSGKLNFKPWLPPHWEALSFKLKWKGETIKININHKSIGIFWESFLDSPIPTEIVINGATKTLIPNKELFVKS